jgi:predicted nucleotide-binding protein
LILKKNKIYDGVRFSADVLREAASTIIDLAANLEVVLTEKELRVEHDDAQWHHDDLEEFFADYRKYKNSATFSVYGGVPMVNLRVSISSRSADVSVKAPSRSEIEAVFDVFEKNVDAAQLPPLPKRSVVKVQPVVFIGHGRSTLWRDLKDHLQDKHSIKVSAYESGARAGHTIRDILEEMVRESSFALLVLTGEDEQADGQLRARQNVVHETGLFQGRLGFSRAIMLLEEGTEDFSNVHGIQQIRFAKGNIKETFGEVLATLKREFDK